MRVVSAAELADHRSSKSCWVVLHGAVYDLTSFLPHHPGGARAILTRAGKDATKEFDALHAPGTLEEAFPPGDQNVLGTFVAAEADGGNIPAPATAAAATTEIKESPADMINLNDFEKHAERTLSEKAWAYYFSASDDMRTKIYNNEIFARVLFRPRVFRDVGTVDTTSALLRVKTTLPVFVCPAALARLAHDDGEKAIARAAGRHGVLQMISNNASLTYTDIVSARVRDDQPFAFQLYVQNDRKKSEKQLAEVVRAGCVAVVLTLDAPAPGKRELDERVARAEARASGFEEEDESEPLSASSGLGGKERAAGGGIGKTLFQGTAADLVWPDLIWLRDQLAPSVKIILKGLQTVEDVVLASQQTHPRTHAQLVDGVLLSNHGGRALEGASPPLLLLAELRKYAPQTFSKLEVYIDGGIRRGTDVVKALCLGATQVGIGRPALFALAGGFGADGVYRAIQILREEIETAMRLLGVTSLDQLGLKYVNTTQLDMLLGPDPIQLEKDSEAFAKARL
ncbi:FMN-dependent dehydrogenase-domain-containing protein [Limtongia smithiae]|uniref:FMN-dependent dehydrogenase-domain-containing protein n=1 Tax=Limtongia smithiae TaxID=1125753 RepID=UPI0034CDBFD1